MNYEQKYKEALERARKWAENPTVWSSDDICQKIFPELKESEDEKMLNQLHSWMKEFGGAEEYTEKVYSWLKGLLEKQGKSIDEFIDKLIKYREWLISKTEQWTKRENNKTNNNADEHYCIGAASALMSARSEFEETFDYESWPEKQGECNPYSGTSFDYNGHVWGMCARDGGVDIICDSQFIKHIMFIEKQGDHKCDCKYVGCHVNDVKRWCHKKQVEVLYENCNTECSEYLKQGEQKPTDKVEPKFKVGDVIRCKYDDREFTIKTVNLERGVYTYTQEGCGNDIDYADEEFELVEQKPWSEEDEHCIELLLPIIDSSSLIPKNRKKCREFLKSLKERISQPHWKPSKEQLEALWDVIPNIPNSEKNIDTITELSSLYEELKNL